MALAISVSLLMAIIIAIIFFRSRQKQKRVNELLNRQNEMIEKQASQLSLQNKKLIELDSFKEGMTGMIVHDLKNPLNVILGLTKNPDVKQAGTLMLNMVMNILDIQKFESAQMKLQKMTWSLSKIVNHAVLQVKMLMEIKSILFQNQITNLIIVNVDFEIVSRVFVNLLTNAIKYTPNNGKITLNAQINKTAFEPSSNFDQFVKITITDTGQGIPANSLELIFDKFAQVEAKNSGGVRSTGLGLSFCKMAVEAHGGKIGVDSELGKGSEFWFTLLKVSSAGIDQDVKNEIDSEQCPIKENSSLLTGSEKLFLSKYTKELSKYAVYEYSSIKNILDSIEKTDIQNINQWITDIRNTLKSCNEEKYNELINI
jgi:signal transduction histidine kinase